MKISAFKHHKQLKYPNGRLMPLNAPVPKINFNSQGVSKFFRVPYLFQCSFFSVHHHLAGPGNFINFFSSQVRTAKKRKTRNKRYFSQGKVNWKSYPLSISISCFFQGKVNWKSNPQSISIRCFFKEITVFLISTITHSKTDEFLKMFRKGSYL